MASDFSIRALLDLPREAEAAQLSTHNNTDHRKVNSDGDGFPRLNQQWSDGE